MIKPTPILLFFALFAVAFGFGGISGVVIGFAQLVFFVFSLLLTLAFFIDCRRPKA